MKKLLLSLLVLGIFFAYSFHQQSEESEARVLTPNPENRPQTTSEPTHSAGSGPTQEQSALPTQSDSSIPSPTTLPQQVASGYKDGSYTGVAADAFYGFIQVRATVSGGKITDVAFLQYPNDRRTSIMINEQAMPYLKQEAIQAQSAAVDIISGATDSSKAFQQSLESALTQAKS